MTKHFLQIDNRLNVLIFKTSELNPGAKFRQISEKTGSF